MKYHCNLRSLLKLRGLTQQELSEKTGIERTRVTKICGGKVQQYRVCELHAIMQSLDCELIDNADFYGLFLVELD